MSIENDSTILVEFSSGSCLCFPVWEDRIGDRMEFFVNFLKQIARGLEGDQARVIYTNNKTDCVMEGTVCPVDEPVVAAAWDGGEMLFCTAQDARSAIRTLISEVSGDFVVMRDLTVQELCKSMSVHLERGYDYALAALI